VNGVAGGSPATGTISSTGRYLAPTAKPAGGSVAIAAASGADSAVYASATVTIPDVSPSTRQRHPWRPEARNSSLRPSTALAALL
jgi:hypothetical protein